jgi:alpha-tubulin suppressor-like RCC1 family protein
VPFPVRVPDLGNVTTISAGRRFSLALLKDGTVRAWGDNRQGAVGDGTTVNRATPVAVQGVRDAVAIAAGGTFGLALLSDGTVMTWCATDNTLKVTPAPALVPGVRGLRAIAAGLSHAAGITDTGTVLTWGANQYHQLGRGRNVPMPAGVVPGLAGVQSLAAVNATTTAVLSSGRIMTWGGVRPWTRPDGDRMFGPSPILLWVVSARMLRRSRAAYRPSGRRGLQQGVRGGARAVASRP